MMSRVDWEGQSFQESVHTKNKAMFSIAALGTLGHMTCKLTVSDKQIYLNKSEIVMEAYCIDGL